VSKDEKQRSVSRKGSRDASPIDPSIRGSRENRLQDRYESSKNTKNHLLINLKKLYKEAKSGKEYSIKN
jgi:hypothetical protein